MRALSLDKSAAKDPLADGKPPADWPLGLKLRMLLLNFLPLMHAAAAAAAALGPGDRRMRLAMAAAVLYLVPPLIVRAVHFAWGVPTGRMPVESRDFIVWWATLQLQTLFCRLPFLEELLRLVPGLYSNWLRLWGARIGRHTYWSAGTLILDRTYLDIGDDVVFGAGVRLNGHVIDKDAAGKFELAVAPIRIGDRAAIGGYCLLTAGTEVAAGENIRACLLSPPFISWKDGKRQRQKDARADAS